MIVHDFSNKHETAIIERLVDSDDIVLDLGANTGYFTAVLAGIAKHVYAFEPEPYNFRQLYQMVNDRNLSNVTTYRAAVSDTKGVKDLYISRINRGMHRLYKSVLCSSQKIPVMTVKVDDVMLLDEHVERLNFVKMDVEGFEWFAILGMEQVIDIFRPIIMSEFHPPSIRESGARPESIFWFFKIHGYKWPQHCITGEFFDNYARLEEVTSDPKGGINLLWEPLK